MKSIFRIVGLALMLSGWIVAALCLHIVRTPNPNDSQKSDLVVVPKARLGVMDTYVDARTWTMADVPSHSTLVQRIIDAGLSEQLKYLTDPTSSRSVVQQLYDMMPGKSSEPATPATQPRASNRQDGFHMISSQMQDRLHIALFADDSVTAFGTRISF